MGLQTRPFDPAEYLDTPEGVAAYLSSAFESDDAAVIAGAIGVVARATGMTKLASDTGLSRQALYKSLSPTGRPEFSTILKVLNAIGVHLTPTVDAADAA